MNKLDIAIEAAKKGAEHALSYYEKHIPVEQKPNHTPVTIADKETEEIIKQVILRNDPDAQFVGEESGGSFDKENFWLIDPIDGTIFFTRDIPLWGILITYIDHGQALFAVSYLPLLNELLYGEKGKGAFLNGKRISISNTKSISDAVFTHGSIHKVVDRLPGFIDLSKKAYKMKGISESYQYHLLATGKTEGLFDGGSSPWDVAGLNMIISEAGGKVTNFLGNAWSFSDNNIIATNGHIHDDVLEIVNQK